MVRNILAAIAGAFIVFVWATISWMVLPWHNWDQKSFQNEGQAMTAALKNEASESGLYTIPNMSKDMEDNEAKQKAWVAQAQSGPFAYISVKLSGTYWNMTTSLFIQFLTQLVVAIIGVWLVTKCLHPYLWQKALFVAYAVTTGVFLVHISQWNWWGFPITSTIVHIVDAFIGWFLAGFAMAKIAR